MNQRHYVMINEVITVSEAAEILGVSVQYIRAQCAENKYVCRKTSDGVWLILKASIPTKKDDENGAHLR